jgi:hypothetical protein
MTTADMTGTVYDRMNAGNPNTMPAHKQALGGEGNLAAAGQMFLKNVDPAVNSYQLATVEALGLHETLPAASILSAYSVGGTTLGQLTIMKKGVTPQTGEIAIAPNGDIVVLGADAITSVCVSYMPMIGEVVEFTAAVATGILTIPAAYTSQGVVYLLEAEGLAGALPVKKNVLEPAAALPATTKAALKHDRTQVLFNHATDALTSARVKLLLAPKVNKYTGLLSEATTV